jgi:hypothetical protein
VFWLAHCSPTVDSCVKWPSFLNPNLLLEERRICVGLLYVFTNTTSASNAYVLSVGVSFRSATGQGASIKSFLLVGVKERYVKLVFDVA